VSVEGWLSIILSVVGIVVGAWVSFLIHRRETKKRLGYRVVTHTPMVSQGAGALELLSIRYDDRRLNDPQLVVLQISNPGSAALRPEDFQNDLRVILEGGARVVSVVGTTAGPAPGADPPSVTLTEGGELEVAPLLLNSGDFIELQVLLDGSFTGSRVVGRVADVRSIEELGDRESPDRPLIPVSPYTIGLVVLAVAILGTAVWLVASLLPSQKQEPEPPRQTFSVSLGDTIRKDTPGKGAGVIEEPGAVDVYTFSAKSAQRVYLQRLDCDNSYDVGLQLLSPDGKPVPNFSTYASSCLGGTNVVTLPATGKYSLQIGSGYTGSSGTYDFKLWESPIERRETTLRSPLKGDIEVPRSQDSYVFQADAGEMVRFDVKSEATLKWATRGPDETSHDGTLFAPTTVSFTFHAKGEYTLTISGDGDDTPTYELVPHRMPSG
jgi:hypothetical protein